jgi:hypothetical protein
MERLENQIILKVLGASKLFHEYNVQSNFFLFHNRNTSTPSFVEKLKSRLNLEDVY